MDTSHDFERYLPRVLNHEKGYVNHPKDKGGPTNKGVTQKVYNAYRGNLHLPPRSVKEITANEVHHIYDIQYWRAAGCPKLPRGLNYAVFDFAINSGVSRAIIELQKVLRTTPDGHFGQETSLALFSYVRTYGLQHLIYAYRDARLDFCKRLSNWSTFGDGWTKRIREVAAIATADVVAPEVDLPLSPVSEDVDTSPKADPSKLKSSAQPEAVGAAVAGIGATGQTLLSTAQVIQPHIGDSLIGKLALVAFVLMILAGGALATYSFIQRMKRSV